VQTSASKDGSLLEGLCRRPRGANVGFFRRNQLFARDAMSTKRKRGSPVDLDGLLPAEDFAAARAEDTLVAAALRRARVEHEKAAGSLDSVQQSQAFMKKMRVGSERALARCIKNRELIPQNELIEALGGKKRWVSEALRTGRLFSLKDGSGHEYIPAFFADDRYDRRALGRVVKALDDVPGESKLFFFTRTSSRLRMTALEALAQGRTIEVVACALEFART
jgi:hypothetical protein